jgi:glucuronoarabinoxylan endo-1,4-beta-xylanase
MRLSRFRRLAPIRAALLLSALAAGSPITAVPAQPPAQAPPAPAPSTATVQVGAVRQPIFGFGGSQTYAGDALADFPHRDAVYKALFQDLKIDIFRLRNYHGYPGEQAKFERVTRDFAQGARKWGGDPKSRGGKAPVRLMFTSWSPPPALKSNDRISGRSDGTDRGQPSATLKKDAAGNYVYGAFADWWLDSLQKFKSLSGAYPTYIALQNELDFAATYEGCVFLPTEGTTAAGISLAGYDRALTTVSRRLTTALGAQSPKIVGPETFSLKTSPGDPNHVLKFIDPATPTGREALSHLFGVSFHIYGTGAVGSEAVRNPVLFQTALKEVRDAYRTNGIDKPLFQTEYLEGETLTAVAGIISDMFTKGDVSAYLVWISARSVVGPGYGLVYFNPTDGSIERRDRFYAVKAFSEYVGEGWNRVETECDNPALKLSAFVGPNRRDLVVVLINPTGQTQRTTVVPDDSRFKAAKIDLHRSSEGESGERWRDLGKYPTDGVVTLLPRSVVTIRFAL